jgi:hypothetical protein
MNIKIDKFNDSSNSWIYRIPDLLVTNPDIEIDSGIIMEDIESAKYSSEQVPELTNYLIHFYRDGSMVEGKQVETLMEQLKDRADAPEIIEELARLGKLRTLRKEQAKAESHAASKADRQAEINDPEWQAKMWRNDLQLQLWDENGDLSEEQRSIYDRQLSGLC